MAELPGELWTQVFDLAADEDVIFQHGLPTSMAESAWFKDFFGEWALRSPQDALDLVQRRSYVTKKARLAPIFSARAVIGTCKQWRDIGAEFLFRCLFFNDPQRLLALCAIMDSSAAASTPASASLGWWTRRIHLTRFYANTTRETTPENLQDALISVIRHCPNLEIFIIDYPMTGPTFGPIADTLAMHTSKSLRTLHIDVPASALLKVTWVLASLPNLFAVHIEFSADNRCNHNLNTSNSDLDDTHTGAASNIHLRLRALAQLSLHGHIQEFVEQATGWALPALQQLSLDCYTGRSDLPDPIGFLEAHGAGLLFLDLYSIPAMPLARILALCPALTTLAFNGDWHIEPDSDDAPPFAHDRLTRVGLHGLAHAFGVSTSSSTSESTARLVGAANDRALSLLCAEKALRFPQLARVRVLSRALLGELDRANGPAEGAGMARWERWWEACRAAGVRLEDCTGALLGELPQVEIELGAESEWEEAEESASESEREGEGADGGESQWRSAVPGTHLDELRRLLDECRVMDEGRDDHYLFEEDRDYMAENAPDYIADNSTDFEGNSTEFDDIGPSAPPGVPVINIVPPQGTPPAGSGSGL
ncbi:hypothetical protein C8R43DRAFT_1072215 [Mycena crocata]|nr:hypothetical protein C8R43DRAFT_1072215 [Mycena crocata]